MSEKIMTRHPDGKVGVNIDRQKYDQIRDYIIGLLKKKGEMSFIDLNDSARTDLKNRFDGSIPWYIVTVKLDLEARGEIERVQSLSPQVLRLK